MARLSFRASNFSGPTSPAFGDLSVSPARLIWGAATVGATPISLGAQPRPLVELCWRAALAAASVEENTAADRWVKTATYSRLDRSEKSAVSYFLGMTQAKITCEMLLGVPHLVHLDTILALLGQTTNESRPDFIGFDLASMTYTIAVEAKGRTLGRTKAVTTKAKEQAQHLPTIVATNSRVCVASVASFDADGYWDAYLEDPVGPYEELDPQTTAVLLVAYYRPLVSALLTAGIDEIVSDRTTSAARLPGMDLLLGLPSIIVTTLRALPLVGPVPTDQLQAVGANLVSALIDLPGKSLAAAAGQNWAARGSLEAEAPTSCTGFDGVTVELGPSWFPGVTAPLTQ